MTPSACPARTHVQPLGVRIATGEPLVAEVAMDQSIAIVMTAADQRETAAGRHYGGTGGGITEIMDGIIAKGMGS